MLYPDPHVLGGLAAVMGEERETVAGWLSETPPAGERMRREGSAMTKRQSDTKTDGDSLERQVKFRELVRAKKLTREEATELFQTAFPEK